MSRRPPRDLEAHWYQVLAAEGFQDIEDTATVGRPLKRWDSFEFTRERNHERRQRHQEYQLRIEEFFRQTPFEEIARLLVKHGNSQITAPELRRIVELHGDGHTEREIAGQLSRSKTCIHKVIVKVRVWMRLT